MHSKFFIMALLCATILVSCVKDTVPDSQTIQILKEKEKIEIGVDAVTIRGEYAYLGVINSLKLRVSRDEHLHGADDYSASLNGKSYTVNVTGLEAGTLYHYCYIADFGSVADWHSEVYTFSTASELPLVETLEVLMIDSLMARVKCKVAYDGGALVLERGVCWNDYGDPTTDDNRLAHAEGGTGEYTCRIEGLLPFSRYYVRAYARNENGTNYGDVMEVATGAEVKLPTVVTVEVTGVSPTSASCLCSVIDDGGSAVTERGVCWRLANSPVETYSYIDGVGVGDYTIGLTELSPNTSYRVRAFAKNSKGFNYGEELAFTTLLKPVMPAGCIDGLFSVANNKQVWFSQGNLIHKPSTQKWDLAEEQYDYIGEGNANCSANYDGWIDLFGWGTSGFDHGSVCYQPWSTSNYYGDYYAYGSPDFDLFEQTGQADWGYNILIEDGDELSHPWRTLTIEEWSHVLYERATPSGIRFAKARVNEVNGVLLMPDHWSAAIYVLNNVNQEAASYSSNMITAVAFRTLQRNGVVFLPAAGLRSEMDVSYAGTRGAYWSATHIGEKFAWEFLFDANSLSTDETRYRCKGNAVRLVRDVERR